MKIVVATDGSEYSKKMIDHIVSRPWAADDQFVIVTVAQDQAGAVLAGMDLGTVDLPEERVHARNILEKDFQRLKESLPDHNIEAKVLSGFAAETICEFAREIGADMIVVGSKGRSGLARLVLGSVAEAVLKNAPCSVKVVKQKTGS
ncbi:MAG TPA: universal stress protein [Candidatus Melainabacteria bacterium]|nr:universal stress protein [Candidatus Melainabacteria bacterium]